MAPDVQKRVPWITWLSGVLGGIGVAFVHYFERTGETTASLDRAVELGCTFFDTAWGYGEGHSEGLLGRLVRS